jgi:nuclear pore complex protein Nup107
MCRSWEDHLWARLSALIGDRIEAKLNETGGFWNRGTLLDRLTLLEHPEEDIKPGFREDTEWEAIISHQLDDLSDLAVNTRSVLFFNEERPILTHLLF